MPTYNPGQPNPTSLPNKLVGEKLDYSVNWSYETRGKILDTSSWTISPAGLTKVGEGYDPTNKLTSISVSGGVLNTIYTLTNTITYTSDAGSTITEIARGKFKVV